MKNVIITSVTVLGGRGRVRSGQGALATLVLRVSEERPPHSAGLPYDYCVKQRARMEDTHLHVNF